MAAFALRCKFLLLLSFSTCLFLGVDISVPLFQCRPLMWQVESNPSCLISLFCNPWCVETCPYLGHIFLHLVCILTCKIERVIYNHLALCLIVACILWEMLRMVLYCDVCEFGCYHIFVWAFHIWGMGLGIEMVGLVVDRLFLYEQGFLLALHASLLLCPHLFMLVESGVCLPLCDGFLSSLGRPRVFACLLHLMRMISLFSLETNLF